ncbi:SLBB domain-containing protein [Undibacterium sp. Jales W-56]|uniref:polysaccharide biosynthesis/export family protein n=1 Tax=Undibacterium sp. Jales W-56 TaxID=2897325 RepID=UPI0021D37E17|nr:SLBB domain-containing protein [Undibacterium sp. Jales W-56]MCU6433888.1 SLBB domain-containing protein [Undibacterium sp. Jales W-56]
MTGGEYSANSLGVSKAPRITNQSLNQNNAAGNVGDGTNAAFNSRSAAEDANYFVKNKKQEKSEFQNFVEYATGKQLPLFGEEFFSRAPSSFAPLQDTPIPSDYVLGAGDEVLIRAWGSVDIDYRATVDRNGLINIPTIGTISMAGVKAGEADAVIKSSIGKLYRDVAVSVSFGRLRAITVYVVGQAKKPGSYTVSGFSTLVTALLVSGGPNLTGSMRNVQVKRQGKVVGSLDLYSFIAKGDKSNDVKLQDGDTIYIPAATGYVALTGKVNAPAIYELKSANESVASILDLAGGMPVIADPRRAFLERIDPNKSQPRTVEEFALNQTGLAKALKNGDLLTVTSITPDFSNAVTLRGNVNQALRVPFRPGMRVRDLIPNREALITRASVQRQNDALIQRNEDVNSDENNVKNVFGDNKKQVKENTSSIASRIGNLIDDVNWDYAVVERVDRATLNVSLVPFNLGRAMDNPDSEDNLRLQAGDAITVFSQNDIQVPVAKRKVFARIEGEVNAPGVYQMGSGETVQSLIAKAGGTTANAYLYGTEFYREKVRQEQQANLEKAVRRLETQIRTENAKAAANQSGVVDAQTTALKLKAEQEASAQVLAKMRELKATGRISFGLAANDDNFNKLPALKLENGDQLVIPSRPDFVHVFGAVSQEASIIWHKGMTVEKYLADAGPTSEADIDGIFVLRANGTVLSSVGRGWFSSINSAEVMPGDSIVVPERLNKETAYKAFTNGLKDWAQILSGFGLGAAAIKTLK